MHAFYSISYTPCILFDLNKSLL